MGRDVIVPPDCASILFWAAFLSLGTSLVAAYWGVYDGMIVAAAVFLCSVNYWRRPVYGWRRNLDIINTATCLLYQTYRCFATHWVYRLGYLASTYTGIGLFFLGRRLHKINIRHGTYAHMFVHILGNVGNIFLFLGLKTKLV
jgi:hypothetical protein